MKVESMVTHAPRDVAVFRDGGLVRLALDAGVHDVVTADGAVVHDHVWEERKSE